ncbi:MAG: 30S ribosomal protein S8 [Cystobacterineae bacterium]|nr:30S ribosomal protein S8 [Cystobacterineae bacterium]
MMVSDPVGDMLTRLRNATRAGHERVVMPSSRLKVEIARVLKEEGYIIDYTVHERKPQNELTVDLKYGPQKVSVIRELKRISRPGLRHYVAKREIPRVLGGLGISILSTSKGILADHEARRQNVGGELLCTVC